MSLQTALINFQSSKLLTAYDESTGKTYVALKPIVEGMGLSWGTQSNKIKRDSRYVLKNIPYLTEGGTQEMLSLDTDHLPAFLYSSHFTYGFTALAIFSTSLALT